MASFYLDHDVAVQLAPFLHAASHRAVTARDMHLERAVDAEHLLLAANNGWIFVTHNAKHLRVLHEAWQLWPMTWGLTAVHAGILIIPHTWGPARAAQQIDAFLRANPPLQNALYEWRASVGWYRHP